MTNFSIIQKSQLEGATRIDAEYYQPEYLDMLKKIKALDHFLLGDITSRITQGPNPQFIDLGKICLNGRNVKDNKVEPENSNYVSDKEFDELKNFRVKIGDILITLKGLGSIGKTGYVFDEIDGIFSRDVGLIRIKDEQMSKFAYAFLLSKFGDKQIERSTTGGTGQRTLAMSYIKNIQIPKFNKALIIEIGNSITESEQSYKVSKSLYQQAESLLLEELGLKGFGNEEKLSSIVNFSEIESVRRIDAEYFQPKYNIILEKTRKNNGKKLGDLVSMKKGIEVGAQEYQDEGKVFIRVSSMTKFGIVESDQKCLSDKLYESLKKDFEPKIGEILLTKDATLGIAYVLKEDIQSIISGGTLRLKIKDDSVEGEYLALCLNSIIGQMQAERDAGGSVIAHWKPEQIKNVIIPVLPKEIQLKISELVQKSHIARKKSKELLEEAKRKVEEMIESA